jgi:hypothetical protein
MVLAREVINRKGKVARLCDGKVGRSEVGGAAQTVQALRIGRAITATALACRSEDEPRTKVVCCRAEEREQA